MVYISKPILVAALVIAPAIAAPVAQGAEEQLEAREPKRRVNLRRIGRGAGSALNHAGNIASVASVATGLLGQRDVAEELEAREPKISLRRIGRGAKRAGRGAKRVGRVGGSALNHAGNIANIASVASSLLGPREVGEELEAREPKLRNLAKLKRLGRGARRAGRGAGRALNAAGTAATVLSMFQGRDFDDNQLEAREPQGKWGLAKKMFGAASAGAGFGALIAPVFRKRKPAPAQVQGRAFDEDMYERDFFDEEDVFGRDFDDDAFFGREYADEELVAREELDELVARGDLTEVEARAIRAGSLLRLGAALGRKAKYLVPAAGLGGFGLGVGAQLKQRELDEMVERDVASSLDEMD